MSKKTTNLQRNKNPWIIKSISQTHISVASFQTCWYVTTTLNIFIFSFFCCYCGYYYMAGNGCGKYNINMWRKDRWGKSQLKYILDSWEAHKWNIMCALSYMLFLIHPISHDMCLHIFQRYVSCYIYTTNVSSYNALLRGSDVHFSSFIFTVPFCWVKSNILIRNEHTLFV